METGDFLMNTGAAEVCGGVEMAEENNTRATTSNLVSETSGDTENEICL